MNADPVTIFWFRRDLRLHDNAGLYHALRSGHPVIPLFIFDSLILDRLEDRDDARVTFIHRELTELNHLLQQHGSSLLVKHGRPLEVWRELIGAVRIAAVFTNEDYEPYARERDQQVENLLRSNAIACTHVKDQVIFSPNEVLKDDRTPYTVFTPYKRKWLAALDPAFHLKAYPTENYFSRFYRHRFAAVPSLETMGFNESGQQIPDKEYGDIVADYAKTRDYPAIDGTSKISLHLRFGTISIRDAARKARGATEHTWLNELIWRDFYAMILWHFPHTTDHAFKKEYDRIRWRNDENEFAAWCAGRTGYPIVDAGMRQLNETGWMHNRVRMIVASFLVKHLLIDWRWGERYFARKLLDYDLASNVGGWQWAAGSGNDAAPYFRVFNPDLQTQKFDPRAEYIKKWVPEFADPFTGLRPIVEHRFARERALRVYGEALKNYSENDVGNLNVKK